jgi:hypothetical protein
VAIARAELAAKASEAVTGVGLLIGQHCFCFRQVLLLMALSAWLVELGLWASLSNLIAGALGIVVGAVLAWVGMTKLRTEHLKPKRTIHELERDVAAVKELT